jgi:hypothetical protein
MLGVIYQKLNDMNQGSKVSGHSKQAFSEF